MRAVTDGRLELTPQVQQHLDLCLDCRACETACPSGVRYGQLIEPFRVGMREGDAKNTKEDWLHRWVLFGLFPHRERLERAVGLARVAQRLGLDRLLELSQLYRLLPGPMRQLATMLPRLGKRPDSLPERLPSIGPQRARVAFFRGCIGEVVFPSTHWATLRVLQQNGCEIVIPQGQGCCGAIHYHAGSDEPAKQLADQTVTAIDPDEYDAIIVNVAGCGSMLKDYGHHWYDDRSSQRGKFAGKVRDVCEFLDELGLVQPNGTIAHRATYHDACHLAHAQGIREAPRRLLRQIPGLELIELAESEICCGAAGTYNLTEPEMAGRLGQRKIRNIAATQARLVVTANAGCLLHIARQAKEAGQRFKLMHPVELLDLSYRSEPIHLD